MRIFRRSIPKVSNIRNSSSTLIPHGLKPVFILVVCLAWTPCTMSQIQGWKSKVRRTLEKFGWKHNSPVFPDDASSADTSAGSYQKHRIPCGLILADATNEDVFPLATSAVAELPKASKDDGTSLLAASTLHVRALEQYPQIEKHVSTSETAFVSNGLKTYRFIPKGTFRLRMGSEESTIEESPRLWIIEGEGIYGGDNDNAIDLVLGTTFWKDHSAEFESDEVYLFTSSSMDAEETTKDRVMVPYLLMRSRISFDAEL